MVSDRPHDRRQFLAGSALTAAALAGADLAHAETASGVHGAIVEKVLSPTELSVSIPDLGVSRRLVLGSGVIAQHGRAGAVATVEAFRPGERVVFMPADGSVDDGTIAVSELSSLLASGTVDASRLGRSANLRGAMPKGRVRATYWVDPSTGERYLCAARNS